MPVVAVTPEPSEPAHAATPKAREPIAFPKRAQCKTGFHNRKGAWLQYYPEHYGGLKVKHWTQDFETRDDCVWGKWKMQQEHVVAPVGGLRPSKLADALANINEKYRKGKKCKERQIYFKGTFMILRAFNLFESFVHALCH